MYDGSTCEAALIGITNAKYSSGAGETSIDNIGFNSAPKIRGGECQVGDELTPTVCRQGLQPMRAQ